MNLVATHYNCTSPMDYISHHALHSHIPIHHYTNHTAVTIHSLALIVSPHLHLIHSHTFKQHALTAKSCSCSGWHFWALFPPAISVFDPGLPDLGTLNCDLDPCLVLFTSLFCPLTIAWLILSNKYCCKWIHSPLTSHYSNNISLTQQSITFAHSYIL